MSAPLYVPALPARQHTTAALPRTPSSVDPANPWPMSVNDGGNALAPDTRCTFDSKHMTHPFRNI